MTEDFFDETFGNVQNNKIDAESLSDLLEQESRRYSRRIAQEDEVMIR